MAFKMKGFSGFKQIEKETPPPPKEKHNPRTYGVDPKRVEKIDTKRDIKLKKANEGGAQTPPKQSNILNTVTVTPKMGMKMELKKLQPKKILPKPIGRKI